jgi:hypothetical protein
MHSKEDLLVKFKQVSELIPIEKRKYLFFDGISNFIFHLESIENPRTRERVTEYIDACLDEMLSKAKISSNLKDISDSSFASHIFKISSIYKDEVGFISKPTMPLVILVSTIFFVLGAYFTSVLFSAGLTIISLIIYFAYTQPKIRARKYF